MSEYIFEPKLSKLTAEDVPSLSNEYLLNLGKNRAEQIAQLNLNEELRQKAKAEKEKKQREYVKMLEQKMLEAGITIPDVEL